MSGSRHDLHERGVNHRYGKRLFINRFNLAMSLATMAFGMAFLLWILFVLFQNGFAALSPTLFTETTPPPGSAGGLRNAIFGSVVIVATATFVSTPIGILAGIYLAEFGKDGWLANATRFINDILLSAPSIVIGLFIYTVYVMQVNHFSGWAGSMALALIAIPSSCARPRTCCISFPTACAKRRSHWAHRCGRSS
jgi:phosphate transport system permease protein